METTSLIVAALVAGLTTGVTDTANAALKDIYVTFKTLLKTRLESKEEAKNALTNLEQKPGSKGRQTTLAEELANLEIQNDKELINLAKAVLEHLDPQVMQSNKYNITIQDGQGIVVGDQVEVTQHFGTRGKRK